MVANLYLDDCSCGWANGGRTCGSNDGSKCWKECCGKKKRSSVDNEEKSGKVLIWTAYVRLCQSQVYSTKADRFVNYSTKISLRDHDYDNLWSNTEPFLTKQENRINFKEFKTIIDQVHILVDYWKFADGNFKNKPVKNFIDSTFSDSNSNICQKFCSNSTNWSALYENIPKISILIDQKDFVISKVNVYLNDILDFYLLEQIYRLQEKESFNNEDIREFSLSKSDLDHLKFHTDLSLSLFNYLANSERITKKQDENLCLFPIKTGLIYIEKFLFMNKSSIKYLEKNADKKNSQMLAYLAKLEDHVQNMMKNYKNFNSIQDFKKSDCFKFFSFFESKWLNSVNWLLHTDPKDLNTSHYNLFVYAIKGSIRFEKFDYFEKLVSGLNQLSNSLNLVGKNYFTLNLLFRDFFNTIMVEDKNRNFESLLNVWSNIGYVPNHNGLNNLNFFLDYVNSQSKDSRYEVKKVKIGVNGKIAESNFRLENSKFNPNDLRKISKLIKENILLPEYLKKEKLDELAKIDQLLMENKFDFVVDGMNIIFLKHNPNTFGNIISLVEILNSRFSGKNFLIFLRDHVFSKSRDLIKKIGEKNHLRQENNRIFFYCIDSIFEDDKFFLYSAVKSNRNTMLISNDYFSNQTHFLNEYGTVFKEWLFNCKVITDSGLRRIFLPPKYKLKCNRIGENKWILPYLNDVNNPRNHSFVQIEKIKINKIKN
ncbi:mitochondrial ribonuclease P 3 [Brachionus plicatilis]|uniref:Mitochondrial ribonuclease P 3 n=1 Tax=Brachionus plicatilis TaxID=10195 RepID=A0A3M7RGE4_BRAPC|nr:mitochondrial ribonuclease P 3 [Brachionus plicatilis]